MKRAYTILRVGNSSAFQGFFAGAPRQGPPPSPELVSVDEAELDAVGLGQLSRDPSIWCVAPVMPTRLVAPIEQSSVLDESWALEAIGAEASRFDGSGVTLAILDAGVDRTHQAFRGVDISERDLAGDGLQDRLGHGTHCSALMIGRDLEGRRIGVARGVRHLLAAKVLGSRGTGSTTAAYRGLHWAVQQGARVTALSLALDFSRMIIEETDHVPVAVATSNALAAYRANLRMFEALLTLCAGDGTHERSMVVVAACGNESFRPDLEVEAQGLAAARGAVGVGALEWDGSGRLRTAGFSNSSPAIAAPGVRIVAARAGGGLTAMSGSSMAAAYVTGASALWWQALAARGVRAHAAAVVSELFAHARSTAILREDGPALRGVGIVRCPEA